MAVTATFRLEQIACRMVPDPAEDISVVNAMLFGNMIFAASGNSSLSGWDWHRGVKKTPTVCVGPLKSGCEYLINSHVLQCHAYV